MSVVEIDGSILEGGGQILRMAITFSCLLKKPIHIKNIRAKRSKPGLAAQHLQGLITAKDICQGRLENAYVGSTEIIFHPGQITHGNFLTDIKTAGSITLIMQVALPLLMFSSGHSQLIIKGGTNADMAPPLDYYLHLWLPLCRKYFGVNIDINTIRRGFFPKGGGEVHVDVSPIKYLKSIELINKGNIISIWGHSFVAGAVGISTANTMTSSAYNYITNKHPHFKNILNIKTEKLSQNDAFGNGSGIYLFAETDNGIRFSGGDNGNPKVNPSVTGLKAAETLEKYFKNDNICTDEYTQDQLILLMALAKGKSKISTGSISLHTKTAIYIAELLSDAKFSIENENNDNCIIICEGIGFENKLCSRKDFK